MSTWSSQYYECIQCGTLEVPHAGHGLCRKCYDAQEDQKWRREWYKEDNPNHKKYNAKYRRTPSKRNQINAKRRERYKKKVEAEGKTYKPHKQHKVYTSKDVDINLMSIKLTQEQKQKIAQYTEEEAQKKFFELMDAGVLQEKHCFEFMHIWRALQLSGEDILNHLVDEFGAKPTTKETD